VDTIFTIDTVFQIVTAHAYLLCFSEKHQYLVKILIPYPQIEATYKQALVDSLFN